MSALELVGALVATAVVVPAVLALLRPGPRMRRRR